MMKYYQEHTYTEVVSLTTPAVLLSFKTQIISVSFQVDILSLGTYLRKFNSKSRGKKNVRTFNWKLASHTYLVLPSAAKILCVILLVQNMGECY